jgi:hypothetical protein
MASSVKASAPASMYLDTRLPEGHVVVCVCAGEEHSFLVNRLGLAVECPNCGRTALSANLIDDYYDRALSLLRLAYGSAWDDAKRANAVIPTANTDGP